MAPLHCPHVFKRFTVRGYCAECAPSLHDAYERQGAIEAAWRERYRAETGRDPLADWEAFETWREAAQ